MGRYGPLSVDDLVAAAVAAIDADLLVDVLAGLVGQPSPTGDERPVAEYAADVLTDLGTEATIQAFGDNQANAVGRLRGGSGPELLLYSPIDTVSSGDPAEDVPWVGDALASHMLPVAAVHGDVLVGLGAQNPKGHAACAIAAAAAIAAARVPLGGDLVVGLGAGGMPTSARPGGRRPGAGHGRGCSLMLERGIHPDAAVIAKSGWHVSWEEVGLTWYEVTIDGTHTYVGSRHLLPYRNAIAAAAEVIGRLESWFPTWAEEHRDGLVAPQGVVSAIEAGDPGVVAFTPASCRFHVDLRISPRTSPAEARRAFEAELTRICAAVGVAGWRCRQVVSIPGTTTDPDAPIVHAAQAAWEAVAGEAHRPVAGLSGATDANILRSRGVPTARVGLPKVTAVPGWDGTEVDFALGMNAVSVADMVRLTEVLVRTALTFTHGADPQEGPA